MTLQSSPWIESFNTLAPAKLLLYLLSGGVVAGVAYLSCSSDSECFTTLARGALVLTCVLALFFYIANGLVALFDGRKARKRDVLVFIGFIILLSLVLFMTIAVMSGMTGSWLAWSVDNVGYLVLAFFFVAFDHHIIAGYGNTGEDLVEKKLLYLVDYPALAGFIVIAIFGALPHLKSYPAGAIESQVCATAFDSTFAVLTRHFVSGAHVFQLMAANAAFVGLIWLDGISRKTVEPTQDR